MKVVFFGTPSIAESVLTACIEDADIDVVAVVCQPDRPVGRKQIITPPPTKSCAMQHGIDVLQPEKIKHNTEFAEELQSYDAEYFVVIAYGKILPQCILDIPRGGALNIHGSLLPKYRGASPIQYALLHGETQTGLTLIYMNDKMDEGDILTTESIDIDTDETSETLFGKMGDAAGSFLVSSLKKLSAGELVARPQDHSAATYTGMIQKIDGCIHWQDTAQHIYQQWQAYTPWPGIYTDFDGKRLRIKKCSVLEGVTYEPGRVVQHENLVIVGTTSGVLVLEEVQLAGKSVQCVGDFVRGQTHFVGSVLG